MRLVFNQLQDRLIEIDVDFISELGFLYLIFYPLVYCETSRCLEGDIQYDKRQQIGRCEDEYKRSADRSIFR